MILLKSGLNPSRNESYLIPMSKLGACVIFAVNVIERDGSGWWDLPITARIAAPDMTGTKLRNPETLLRSMVEGAFSLYFSANGLADGWRDLVVFDDGYLIPRLKSPDIGDYAVPSRDVRDTFNKAATRCFQNIASHFGGGAIGVNFSHPVRDQMDIIRWTAYTKRLSDHRLSRREIAKAKRLLRNFGIKLTPEHMEEPA